MKKQGAWLRCLVALAVLAGCVLGVLAAASADRKGAPRPLPPEVLKGWRDAGAEVGWMNDLPSRACSFKFWGPWREEGEAGAMPAFRFPAGRKGALAKLPDPGTAYGLDFHCGFAAGVSVKELARLKNLRLLNLGAANITDADLKELTRLKDLQGLYLFYNGVTDDGMKHVAGLKKLKVLDLTHTSVTDGGLEDLARLKELQALNLSHTRVTDDGLKELARLKKLRWLDLAETNVTHEGVAALKKDLPECKIATPHFARGTWHDDP